MKEEGNTGCVLAVMCLSKATGRLQAVPIGRLRGDSILQLGIVQLESLLSLALKGPPHINKQNKRCSFHLY